MSGPPEMSFSEISYSRDIIGDKFANGVQDFSWSVSRPSVFIPNKSYFRFSLTINGLAGTVPTASQKLAFADSVCSNLYNNVYFKAGGQNVSSLVSYIPQASQIKNRLMLSGAWTDSIGKSAFMINPSFDDRIQMTSLNTINVASGGAASVAVATTGVVTGTNTAFATTLSLGDVLYCHSHFC